MLAGIVVSTGVVDRADAVAVTVYASTPEGIVTENGATKVLHLADVMFMVTLSSEASVIVHVV